MTAPPTKSNRRACSCGEALTADGPLAARLLDRFDRDHTGQGHGPAPWPASEDGRKPRTRPTRTRKDPAA